MCSVYVYKEYAAIGDSYLVKLGHYERGEIVRIHLTDFRPNLCSLCNNSIFLLSSHMSEFCTFFIKAYKRQTFDFKSVVMTETEISKVN